MKEHLPYVTQKQQSLVKVQQLTHKSSSNHNTTTLMSSNE